MSKWYIPDPAKTIKSSSSQVRAEFNCYRYNVGCTPLCHKCIFDNDDWTPEREAAFLEWESNQSKGE